MPEVVYCVFLVSQSKPLCLSRLPWNDGTFEERSQSHNVFVTEKMKRQSLTCVYILSGICILRHKNATSFNRALAIMFYGPKYSFFRWKILKVAGYHPQFNPRGFRESNIHYCFFPRGGSLLPTRDNAASLSDAGVNESVPVAGDWLQLRRELSVDCWPLRRQMSHYIQHPISWANSIIAAFVMQHVRELE